ncbi:hypothetical protein M2368_003513 [Arthrobacter sp. JUb119]|uniref:hypothetical protein n=1 Tax=Arthrobacter sp. JUb115 TaxID=2485108 RepID=UPI001AAF747A|nr:hypothetical protein [Arthrobacter sp. JUb115]MCS3494481.1 hypothetical protein [Arthrobacter sp. JUb119]
MMIKPVTIENLELWVQESLTAEESGNMDEALIHMVKSSIFKAPGYAAFFIEQSGRTVGHGAIYPQPFSVDTQVLSLNLGSGINVEESAGLLQGLFDYCLKLSNCSNGELVARIRLKEEESTNQVYRALDAINFRKTSSSLVQRLKIEQNSLTGKLPTAFSGQAWVGDCPEELIRLYAPLVSLSVKDSNPESKLPPESSIEASISTLCAVETAAANAGRIMIAACIFDQTGQAVAHTRMSVDSNCPNNAIQGVTYVKRGERRKGLGVAVKSMAYEELRTGFPLVEYVETTNGTTNQAVLSMNKAAGYVKHSVEVEMKYLMNPH